MCIVVTCLLSGAGSVEAGRSTNRGHQLADMGVQAVAGMQHTTVATAAPSLGGLNIAPPLSPLLCQVSVPGGVLSSSAQRLVACS